MNHSNDSLSPEESNISSSHSAVTPSDADDESDHQYKGITVLLLDERPWWREALSQALEVACRDFNVLRFASVSELAQAPPHEGRTLVLVNVAYTKPNDSLVTQTFKTVSSSFPLFPIVALSDTAGARQILSAFEHGLKGFAPISLGLKALIDVLRFVSAGGTFLPAEILSLDDDEFLPRENTEPMIDPREEVNTFLSIQKPVEGTGVPRPRLNDLTVREREVLELLQQGRSNKQIARDLDISEATVKVYVRQIMRKLGVGNRTQAALAAEELLGRPAVE